MVENVQELKDKDVILQRLRLNKFEELNTQTIMHHDLYKDSTFLLQENSYLGTPEYL